MKKLVCLLLTLTMILGCISASFCAFAAEKVLPVIDLRGFMSSQLSADKDDDDSERLFPQEKNAILTLARKLLAPITKFTVDKNWDVLGNKLIPALNEMLMPIASDEVGDAKNNTGVHFAYPTKAEIAKDPELEFVFDWRDDPFVSASQLNDFVNYVADDCGYGEVALECHSYAGVVTLTYLATYGTGKIRSVCFNATAVYGATFAGELMQGKVNLSADGLAAFLEGLVDQSEYEGLLRGLVTIFEDLGGLTFLCSFINDLFTHLSDRIWKECVVPVFGSWLSIWAMVPDDKLEAGKAFIAKTGVAQSETFRARTEQYNTSIRAKREPLLRGVNDKSNLYVIARYGYAGVPLGDIWTANTDGVLSTEAESFGATCERLDFMSPDIVTLPLRSPNGAIDASTCLFPMQTWFIRNCKHTEHDPVLKAFTTTLLRADGQQTVESYKEYPQYMVLYKTAGGLLADDGSIRDPRRWQDDILALLKNLMKKMVDKFKAALRLPF